MEQKAKVMNIGNMVTATELAKSKVERAIEKAKNIEQDAHKDARLSVNECKACFYFDRIGGSAITSRECMCCHEVQTYASTSTDVLCKPCAEKHSLCKHCGGDRELRAQRRKWPESAQTEGI